MYYNLAVFGEKLRSIREKLHLTQKQAADMAYVDERTLRRTEQGQVIPKLETLEALSVIYKTDLVSAIIESRINDYSILLKMQRSVDLKLINEETLNFDSELKILEEMSDEIENEYYRMIITRFRLFLYGIKYYKNKEYTKALEAYTSAIRQTLSGFTLDNYREYEFSSMEIRILMDVALVFDKLEQHERYKDIMEFCFELCGEDNDIYPRICHNLAAIYRKNEEFIRALDYTYKGINSCKKNMFSDTLAVLYYGKAFAECKLGDEEYKHSINTALTLCKVFGQTELQEKIIYNCKNVLKIAVTFK